MFRNERSNIVKKTLGILLAAALVIGLMATAAFAAAPGDGVRDLVQAGDQNGNTYRHADGSSNFVDLDGDGRNDNFVDADGDGECDNYADRERLGTGGMGQKGPHGTGDGTCDGDGGCDFAGTGQMGGGMQHGRSR